MQTQEVVHERRSQPLRAEQSEALKQAEFLPQHLIDKCSSFRDAVWLSWQRRRLPGMTKAMLAAACDLYAPHVTSFVNPSPIDGKGKRRADLPADKIREFEAAVGNRAPSQYLSDVGCLTLMEEMIANKRA